MFGKHFASMYEGSLVGKGAVVFAVWGYIIAKQVPDKVVGSQVRLNPVLLSAVLGESVEQIEGAVAFLCAPDPKSTTPDEQGRRLIKIGQFDYKVVNGAKYRAIRDEEERRKQNRAAQQRFRQKKGQPLPGEAAFVESLENGEPEEVREQIVEQHLPSRRLG